MVVLHVYTTCPLLELDCVYDPNTSLLQLSHWLSCNHKSVYVVSHVDEKKTIHCFQLPWWLVQEVRIKSLHLNITHIAFHVVKSMNIPWMMTRVAPNASWKETSMGSFLTTRMDIKSFFELTQVALLETSEA